MGLSPARPSLVRREGSMQGKMAIPPTPRLANREAWRRREEIELRKWPGRLGIGVGAPEPSLTKKGATRWDGETDVSENSRRIPGVRRRRRLLIGMENLGLKETEIYRRLR